MKCYKMMDVVSEIFERENRPSTSGYDRFVGLEYYVSGDVEITNYGSTANLDSAMNVFHSGDILVVRRNVYLYPAITRQTERLVILYNDVAYHLRNYTSKAFSDIARHFTCLFKKPDIVKLNSGI